MSDTHEPTTVCAEQTAREEDLIRRVLASFEDTPDERLKYLLEELVKHLHSYVRTVRLSEEEWNRTIGFLTRAGHITTPTRQEFVLLSDVLGLSMQTVAVNNEAIGDATDATVFGPFFVNDSPRIDQGQDISAGAPGEPAWVEGSVTDTDGQPVPGARIEVWEADEEGLYDVQHENAETYGRGHLFADEDGTYRFWGCFPPPTRSPTTDRSATCSRPPDAALTGRHTCTSW